MYLLRAKLIRGNEKPHMKGNLKKAIMKRSYLKNLYNKSNKCGQKWEAYRKQRNLVCKLNKQAKLNHFQNVCNESKQNSKIFSKLFNPYFTNFSK